MTEFPPVLLCLGAIALWVVPLWLMTGGWGSTNPTHKTTPMKKSRAQHEAELEQMWREEVNPAPPTKAERARWAKENNETYIENVAAWAEHETFHDEFGNVSGWEDYVIDRYGNKVVTHNSEKTGTRDGESR